MTQEEFNKLHQENEKDLIKSINKKKIARNCSSSKL